MNVEYFCLHFRYKNKDESSIGSSGLNNENNKNENKKKIKIENERFHI